MQRAELRPVKLKVGLRQIGHAGHPVVGPHKGLVQRVAHLKEALLHALRARFVPQPFPESLPIGGICPQQRASVGQLLPHEELVHVLQGRDRLAVPFPDQRGELFQFLVPQAFPGIGIEQQRKRFQRLLERGGAFLHPLQLPLVDSGKTGMFLGHPVRQLEQAFQQPHVLRGHEPPHFLVGQDVRHILTHAAPHDATQHPHAGSHLFRQRGQRAVRLGRYRLDHIRLVEYLVSRKSRWEFADLGQL